MKIVKKLALSLSLLVSTMAMNAQNLGDILGGLGGKNSGDIIGSLIEGVFTKTNLTLDELIGEYVSQGPAVTFKSESLLQKAGGLAGASKIESELKPYYEKYGLTGMTLTVDSTYNFSMKVKGIGIPGEITKNDDGTFEFHFKVLGIKIGSFTAYIEKSGSTLKLMFDATKLKNLLSQIVKLTGNSMATTVATILDSYEGACIGFRMVSTQQNNSSGTGNSGSSDVVNKLKDILNKRN